MRRRARARAGTNLRASPDQHRSLGAAPQRHRSAMRGGATPRRAQRGCARAALQRQVRTSHPTPMPAFHQASRRRHMRRHARRVRASPSRSARAPSRAPSRLGSSRRSVVAAGCRSWSAPLCRSSCQACWRTRRRTCPCQTRSLSRASRPTTTPSHGYPSARGTPQRSSFAPR